MSKSRLIVLRASDSLNTALSLLMQGNTCDKQISINLQYTFVKNYLNACDILTARVSAIPIVDKDGCLVDIFARRYASYIHLSCYLFDFHYLSKK